MLYYKLERWPYRIWIHGTACGRSAGGNGRETDETSSMNSKKAASRKPAAAIGCLLLFSIVTALPVIAVPPPAPAEIALLPVEEETFFLEVRQEERRKKDILGGFEQLRLALGEKEVRVEEVWAGDTRLYLKLVGPADTVAGRNALVDEMLKLPLVAQVISSHAAPNALRDLHRVQNFESHAAIPEAKLHGFRGKMRDFYPDATSPHTGEVIVKYLQSETFTADRLAQTRRHAESLHQSTGGRVVGINRSEDGEAELVALPEGSDIRAALATYLASDHVEYAQPNYVCEMALIPNDPEYPFLWGMDKISAPAAWDTRTDASSVIVAVVDTGVNYLHPDLAGNMWSNPSVGALGFHDGLRGADIYNNDPDPMDDNSHGSHCAGTIGAVGNNGSMVTGVAWTT